MQPNPPSPLPTNRPSKKKFKTRYLVSIIVALIGALAIIVAAIITRTSPNPTLTPSTLSSPTIALATSTPISTLPSSNSITIDVTTSKLGTLHASTVTTDPFSTSSPNELLLAFISSANASGKGAPTISLVSGAGLTWVEAAGTNSDARGSQVRIFRAFAPSMLSSQTVTATSSDSSSTVFISVVTLIGVDTTGTNGSGAVGVTGTATGVSFEPSKTITTTKNNSWVWGVGSDPQSDIGYAPKAGSNQTVNASGDNTTDKQQHWVNKQNATTPSSGTNITINNTLGASDVWELAVIEILPRSSQS